VSIPIKSIVGGLLQPMFDQDGFELVDVEYVKEGNNWFLRVFADKAGGIDIDDCGKISEYLSVKLDETDPIAEAYFLEVSSPGAERPLNKQEDVLKAIGNNVFITTYEQIDKLKEFEGILVSFENNEMVVQTKKKKHTIPYEKVASARLAVLF